MRAVISFAAAGGALLPMQSAVAINGPTPGTEAWVAREAGAHGAYDQLGGMATSPDGSRVYLATTSAGAIAVVARDAGSGARLWVVHTPGPGGKQIFADAVAVSPDGTRLFVTGDIEQSIDTRSVLTAAYETASGSPLWSAQLSVGNHREAIPRRIAVNPQGTRVFVTGSRTGRQGIDDFWDYFTVGYSAGTGARKWTSTYAGPAKGGDTSEGIGVSPDGTRVFVTGTSVGSGTDRDFATIAYAAADGRQVWVSRYDAGADDFASNLVVSPNGSLVYVAGFGRATLSLPHGFRTVAYHASTGTQSGLTAEYNNGADDMATDLAISSDGSRVFVTGSGNGDFVTVAYDAPALARLWATSYDGGHGADNANAIAVKPDGTKVYVTGLSEEGRTACFGDVPQTVYATVEYGAATGATVWVARYAGLRKHPDEAREVAVSPDGGVVFVTGNSDFACKSSDVATVAYHT